MPTATDVIQIESPINGEILSDIDISRPSDLNDAVQRAESAFKTWSSLTIKQRAQIFLNYRQLLIDNKSDLTELAHKENGKTFGEAEAEVDKAIEITEFAASLPQIAVGEHLEVSRGVHCGIQRDPLGVVASITPFNFPIMVPHWTIPIALMLGNCMILKPSEVVPLSAIQTEKLLRKAGLPEGVFQVVNGGKEIVEALCDHPGIKALSFVGSTNVAKIVYKRASANLKNALCLGGAKNHLIVLPDAHLEMTAANIAASMSGCAGQRCMAASVMVGVGDIDAIVDQLCKEAKQIIPGQNMGSVISKAAKERIEHYITEAENNGAKILIDGRNTTVKGNENGYYVGPTIIDNVRPDMAIAKDEVFGPVLSIIRTSTIEEALTIQNSSQYGNGAAVFTQNGAMAKRLSTELEAGMIGINIGVPVPREPFSFGGHKASKFGTGDITGKSSIEFWTQPKKITSKWNPEDWTDWMS